MDVEFAKMRFKSLMTEVRYLSEKADAELAQTMHRELEREIGVLLPKIRMGSEFSKNRLSKDSEGMVESRPTG